jgi:imidazolonepropionase-like amidohydrolase
MAPSFGGRRIMFGIASDGLIDGVAESGVTGPHVIVVNAGTGIIDSVVPGDGSNLGAMDIIRLPKGATILPGFIDCHVHLTIFEDDYQLDHLRLSSAAKALRALKAAQGLLQAGFTTVRSAGDADTYFPSFAVAKSIDNGEFIGPRIVGAGHYISVTGGGGDINFFAPDSCPCCNADGVIADGKDQMILAVRKEIKYGSDWIKLLATGAFMTASTGPKDSPENTHMSEEEIRSCVEEANRRKVHVMAHAHGADGIAKAANAGCRSIEHASFIDAAGIEACLRNNTWIVPTFMIGEYYETTGSKTGAQDRMIQLAQQSRER